MGKKKVIELIEDVIKNNVDNLAFGDDKHNAPLRRANEMLHDALIELSKPDWISVGDELPPYKEDVIVCNNIKPKKVWMAYRSERDYFKKDDNDFVLHGDYEPSVTHWLKIDKLGYGMGMCISK